MATGTHLVLVDLAQTRRDRDNSPTITGASPGAGATTPPQTKAVTTTTTTTTTSPGADKPLRKKQCWECQRRRLVCDSVEPVCGKCEAAGVVCPGFDDKKPLTWLAPGKVSARPRKGKRAPNGSRAAAAAVKKGQQEIARVLRENNACDYNSPANTRARNRALEQLRGAATDTAATNNVKDLRKAAARHPDKFHDMYESTFVLFPELVLDKDIEQTFQASRYYDMQIFPEYVPILEMIPGAFVRRMDLRTVPYFPESVRHSIICLTVGHRIGKLPKDTDPRFVAKSWSVFYKHRGKAISALSKDMNSLDPVKRFVALVGTATFLTVDIQQCYPDWRVHYIGLRHIIDLCGGLDVVTGLSVETRSMMNFYVLCGVLANAITHRDEQLTCVPADEQRKFVAKEYDERIMPYFMCPRDLTLVMIEINELRREASAGDQSGVVAVYPDNDQQQQQQQQHQYNAYPSPSSPTAAWLSPTPAQLIAQIDSFDPLAWAGTMTKTHAHEVAVLGEVLKTAIYLYCIVSLQATGHVPSPSATTESGAGGRRTGGDPEIELSKALLGDKLFSMLRRHIRGEQQNLVLQRCSMFGIAVAGFLAKFRSEEDRAYIVDECEFLSKANGQASALMMCVALQRFWASPGSVDWDDCFREGYALSVA